MDRLIVVRVVLQLQAVDCDALRPDRNLGQVGPDLGIEAVLVHTQVPGGMLQPNESGLHGAY